MKDEYESKILELKLQKDNAYWERNQLLCLLSRIYPSWIEKHPDTDNNWDNDYRNIIFIRLPNIDASWHIHHSDIKYFSHLELKEGNSWDGHTMEEKYRRINFVRSEDMYPRNIILDNLNSIRGTYIQRLSVPIKSRKEKGIIDSLNENIGEMIRSDPPYSIKKSG